MEGYITLHRGLCHTRTYEVPLALQAYIKLLMQANISEKKVEVQGKTVVVRRGELLISREGLNQLWNGGEVDNAKNLLRIMRRDGLVDVNRVSYLFSIIKLKFYDAVPILSRVGPKSSRPTLYNNIIKKKESKESNDYMILRNNDKSNQTINYDEIF